jgi:hypothetical protein
MKKNGAPSPCSFKIIVSHSLSEYPVKNRQHQRNDDAGRNRKVEAEPFSLDIDITGKMADSQFGQSGPGHSNQNENDANDDEPLCHDRYLSIDTACYSPHAIPVQELTLPDRECTPTGSINAARSRFRKASMAISHLPS